MWCPVSWYLPSAADRDTHYGQLRDGRVHALCGAQVPPTITLPGDSRDYQRTAARSA